ENFARERIILARLRHPGICRIIDGGADHGQPFIVMELIDGIRIDDFCRRWGRSVGDAIALFSQILTGVEDVHQQGIVHRDLKPSNILVSKDGGVKVLDFGIAKFCTHAPGQTGSRTTITSHRVMTMRYASPEQLQGKLSGRASDVYSLGVILYELLADRHPF